MHNHDKGRLKSFARAFRKYEEDEHTCKCGVTYRTYDTPHDADEIEDESIAYVAERIVVINFENAHFADCCPCWHPRALKIIDWLECYGDGIVKFFQAEIHRKQQELDDAVDPRKHYYVEQVPEGLEKLLKEPIRVIDPSDLAPN